MNECLNQCLIHILFEDMGIVQEFGENLQGTVKIKSGDNYLIFKSLISFCCYTLIRTKSDNKYICLTQIYLYILEIFQTTV